MIANTDKNAGKIEVRTDRAGKLEVSSGKVGKIEKRSGQASPLEEVQYHTNKNYCPMCGKQYASDSIAFCPDCGHPRRVKKTW